MVTDPDKLAQRQAFTYRGIDLHDKLLKRSPEHTKCQVAPGVLNQVTSKQPATTPTERL